MAARGGLVGVGGLSGASSIAHEEEVHDLLSGLGLEFGDSCNDNPFFGVISEIKVA